jgi:pilus assembly protein CpaB
MGFQANWQRDLSRRWTAVQLGRAAQDQPGGPRRTPILMLLAAAMMGLAALFLSRNLRPTGAAMSASAVHSVPVVVAAAPIGFGQRLTPDLLTVTQWPADALPRGSFQRIDELATGEARAALRPIAPGEIILNAALAGGAVRLSAAPLLGPTMRAMAVPVSEASGVSGFVQPGDRVDVFLTRTPEEALPYAELVAQAVRVLAVGPDMNVGREQPELVKSVTLEVNALQGQKLTLAIATGQLSLALRHFTDEGRVRLQTLQVADLNDGTTTRLLAKPRAEGDAGNPKARPGRPSVAAAGVLVVRGTEATTTPVLP